jgi:thiol-disulfide isomerase/thioredoxin
MHTLLTVLVLVSAPPAERADLPRYRLEVGQEIVYAGQGEFKYKGGAHRSKVATTLWVTGANRDGSWRVVLRETSVLALVGPDGKERARPASHSFGTFDLYPDGRVTVNDTLGYQLNPPRSLPRLPRDAGQAKKGWSSPFARTDEVARYKLRPRKGASGPFVIEATYESALDAIYGLEAKAVITFDPRRGLPEKIDLTGKQTYGFDGKSTGTVELKGVKKRGSAWMRDFAAEAERYFEARATYERLTRARARTAAQTRANLDRAEKVLKEALGKLEQVDLKKQLEAQLEEHRRYAKYYVEDAERRAGVLDRPAPEFETTDLDGKKVALKDCRGKVVVLDFWYRGCGWCVRAMPQMKQIASHFKGKPVVVFGMNTDRKLEDAKFVVEKMKLNYANLRAEGLPAKFKVQAFPTLLIVDQKGVVRDIHVGYSATLKEEVVRSVEKLLKGGE